MRVVLPMVLVLAGCATWSDAPAAVYGPFRRASEGELYARALEAVRTVGYEPLASDGSAGWVTFASHSQLFGRCRATFVLRLYRGGHVELRAAGCGVLDLGDARHRMPSELMAEYAGVAAQLTRHLEGEP